jgi:hypothetical protein
MDQLIFFVLVKQIQFLERELAHWKQKAQDLECTLEVLEHQNRGSEP